MHEAGLMQEALDLAMAAARGQGAERIVRLRLRVGTESGIVPEALAFGFEAVRVGTIAAAAVLDIELAGGADLQLASIEVIAP